MVADAKNPNPILNESKIIRKPEKYNHFRII
jgi:hypothetical protein